MFGNAHFDRTYQLFADQFEENGDSFLYRKSMKGAPIRVSEAERDEFVTTFRRRVRYTFWMVMPATFLLIGVLVIFGPEPDSTSADIYLYCGLAAIMAPFVGAYLWAWYAPARELARRPPTGAAPTRDEVRRRMFSRMTYGQYVSGVGACAFLLWKVSIKYDVLHGWGLLWPICAGTFVVGISVQTFRKWRYESK